MIHGLMLLQAIAMVFYLTKVLMYSDKSTHFGPFRNDAKDVINPITNHSQPVTLFDYIRRFSIILNPYESVGEELWMLDRNKMEVWTCPICLSFWVTFLVTLPIFIFGIERNLLELILFHYSICGSVSFLFILLGTTDK